MNAKRTESYSAAAARRSYENLTMERAASVKARLEDTGLGAARRLPCPKGSEPGAFSAIACVTDRYSHDLGMFIEPAALRPLPRAVLVHLGHDITKRAVAVGVPTYADGAVQVDCVFRSLARDAWARVQSGEVRSTSIYAYCDAFYRGVSGRLVKGVLVAVDLVPSGADERAHITRLVAGADLTPAQRQVQERLDRYLADPASPCAVDFLARAGHDGVRALEPLRSVVAPLFGEPSEPLPSRRASSTAPVRVLTRNTAKRLCGASLDGFTCEHPAGHSGMHFSEMPPVSNARGTSCMAWDDRAISGAPRRSQLARVPR